MNKRAQVTSRRTAAVGYVRVSDGHQVKGVSLDDQEAAIRAWCQRNDLNLLKIYREEAKKSKKRRKKHNSWPLKYAYYCPIKFIDKMI